MGLGAVEGVGHSLVLGVFELKHLLDAEVFEDFADGAHGVAVAGDGDVAGVCGEPLLQLVEEGHGAV